MADCIGYDSSKTPKWFGAFPVCGMYRIVVSSADKLCREENLFGYFVGFSHATTLTIYFSICGFLPWYNFNVDDSGFMKYLKLQKSVVLY